MSKPLKKITGMGRSKQTAQPEAEVEREQVRPLAATGGQAENQEEAGRDLYRRRRARGIATSPMGLSGQAMVRRKTLLGS